MKRCLPIVAVLAMATVANAAIITSWDYQGELTAGYNTYWMMVSTDSDWTNSRLEVYLDSGTMNHINWPLPPFMPMPTEMGPTDSACTSPSYVPTVAEWSESPTELIMSWGDTDNYGPGDWKVGLLTISLDSNGQISGKSYESADPGNGVAFSYIILDGGGGPPPPPPPTAYTPSYVIDVGDPLVLDASGSQGDDMSFEWDLDDDGTFETNAGGSAVYEITYAYLESLGLGPSADPYDIHLEVTDSWGTDTDSATLTIIPEPATLLLMFVGTMALIRKPVG